MSTQDLDTLEDGADVYNIINRLTPVMPTGNWSHGVTYDSIIFPDEYEKPPREESVSYTHLTLPTILLV